MAARELGVVHLDVSPSTREARGEPVEERPFRILVLGDLRGEGTDPSRDWQDPGTVAVDRDTVDEALALFRPRVSGMEGEGDTGDPWALELTRLEHFHPDTLYGRLPPLQPLRRWHQELQDPERARRMAEGLPGREPAEGSSHPPRMRMGPGGLLDEIVSAQDREGDSSGENGAPREGGLEAFLRQVVAPHLVPGRPPDQARLLGDVESALAERLRRSLHDPAWQALESVWRGVGLLCRRLETDRLLQVHLRHLPRHELPSALGVEPHGGLSASPGAASPLVRALTGSRGGETEWGMVVGAWSFGQGEDGAGEVALLRGLAALGEALGAPVVTSVDPGLGADGFPRGWEELRRSPEARWLGLTVPRFLLRLPYGEEGDPCEALSFEEFPPGQAPPHEGYLWGNGAFLLAMALGERYSRGGWDGLPGSGHRVQGLPLDIRKVAGTAVAKPVAERVLRDGEIHALLELGLLPLACHEGGDAVHLPGLRSVAAPAQSLAGPWLRMD